MIASRVILHPGAVIGSDGFGYELRDGRQQKIPQTGIVQIDDDVEIGANSTVDRARFGRTWIQEGVKIDNLVQIAHNVTIGRHSVICAHVGISGSVRMGSYVTLAGKVGVNGHIEIGDGAIVTAMAGITKSVPPREILVGLPAKPMREYKRKLRAASQHSQALRAGEKARRKTVERAWRAALSCAGWSTQPMNKAERIEAYVRSFGLAAEGFDPCYLAYFVCFNAQDYYRGA